MGCVWATSVGGRGAASGAGGGGRGVGERVSLTSEDLSGLAGEARGRALAESAQALQRSLDLGRGPLLRAGHYRLGEEGERLLLVVHHLVVDGVSWRVLLEDLARGYEQARRGEGPSLPRKSSSYRRWAEALKEYAGSERLASERSYWREVEEGPTEELPGARDGDDPMSGSRTETVRLSGP